MINVDCIPSSENVVFVLRNLDSMFHDAARDLAFTQAGNDFARSFPAAPHIEPIFETFRRAIPDVLAQTARLQPVPWQLALELWLQRLDGCPVDWFLGGSAALAMRGIDVAPRDIDIITSDAGAGQLGQIFAAELIEPVVPVAGWVCNWFGRAFMRARFEWVGGVNDRADTPDLGDFGPAAARCLESVVWRGHTLRVPPLDLQLAVSKRRGLSERVAAIERHIG